VDGASEEGDALGLFEMIRDDETLTRIPVLIYAQKGLSERQYALLKRFAESVVVKEIKSTERLLDEMVLFLHLVEDRLPQEKKNVLTALHDREAVFQGKKILIVDDDVRNVFALTRILEDKGFKVVAGENGIEGLKRLENNPDTDIVLMDIMMPEMDGYEAVRRIRLKGEHKALPIIALTAKAMKGDRIKCIEAGASDYLAKPVDADRLFSLLRVWLYR
jgi:CheY-like chemotaxis protein